MIMSHYDILGAPANADYAEIRSKYRAAILALHPDKFCKLQDQPAQTLHSDSNHGLGFLPRQVIDDTNVPPDELNSSQIKELYMEDRGLNSWSASNAGEFGSIGEEDILSRFLRVQKAWEVLRDPESRATYDSFLASERFAYKINYRGGESTRVIGEEILLRDMDVSSVDGDHEREYSYPCRCGDFFFVSQGELGIAGVEFKGETSLEMMIHEYQPSIGSREDCQDDSLGSSDATGKAALHQVDRWIRGSPEAHRQSTNSMVLPCQSCSLHIRLNLFPDESRI